MTATIYARIGDALKAATDQYAADNGLSISSAVNELLSKGLVAAGDEDVVDRLENRVRVLESELGQIRQAAGGLNGRMEQVLGECQCGNTLTGHDLLVAGRCPACARGVTRLLTDTHTTSAAGTVDRAEFAPFLTGVGVTLAVVLVALAAGNSLGG